MSNRHNSIGARTLFPLALALVVAGTAPVAAQTEPTAMQKIFGAMGLIEMPKDPIEYRERAPLVVPPAAGLVPPRSPGDMSQFNPDWPVDHDSRRENDDGSHMATENPFYSGEWNNAGTPKRLSREEAARREAAARRPEAQTGGALEATGDTRLSPSQLKFRGWNKKQEERVVFTGEPERRNLTEPPRGLRTPSVDAPYGIVTQKAEPFKHDPYARGDVDR